MAIAEVPGLPAWAILSAGQLYVVGLNDEGLPAQRYWGPALPQRDWPMLAAGLSARWRTSSSRPAEAEEDILPRGGLRWGVSGIALRWANGDTEFTPEFDSAQIEEAGDAAALRIVMADSLNPELRIDLVYRAHDTLLERWVELSLGEGSDEMVVVERLDSANWLVPDQRQYRISAVAGHWGAENSVARLGLPHGELRLGSRTGTTGHHANPWVMVDDGEATETHGTVRTVGLAWSGTWHIDLQRRPEGAVSVAVGAGHESTSRLLRPGQFMSSPASFGLLTEGGWGAASRALHTYASQHAPRPDRLVPVLYNSWEATSFDVSLQGQLALAERAARVGAELFVVDDGWFGRRTDDTRGLGDWTPNPDRFPDGLHTLVRGVRALGMSFGLWVEPEMVNPDSELYRAHPDWVMNMPGRERRTLRNQLVLNFAREDVREWALEWLTRLIHDYALDFLKWDMNRPFSQAGWPENHEDQGSLWFEHVEGVYAILDRLRKAAPELAIESCSGGGGRVDLGMAKHVDWFWTSDNTDALDRQSIQYGFSQVYPARSMMNWVTDSPNPITGRLVPLAYRFHVAMAGALGLGGDLSQWSEAELSQASDLVAQYKGFRDVVQFGELHRLGGLPGRERSAVEYVWGDRVVVLGYEPRRSLDAGPRLTTLRGLERDADYQNVVTGAVFSGGLLMDRGLELFADLLSGPRDGTLRFSARDFISVVLELRRLPSSVHSTSVLQ